MRPANPLPWILSLQKWEPLQQDAVSGHCHFISVSPSPFPIKARILLDLPLARTSISTPLEMNICENAERNIKTQTPKAANAINYKSPIQNRELHKLHRILWGKITNVSLSVFNTELWPSACEMKIKLTRV